MLVICILPPDAGKIMLLSHTLTVNLPKPRLEPGTTESAVRGFADFCSFVSLKYIILSTHSERRVLIKKGLASLCGLLDPVTF
jgi:hypothetical protein